MICDFGKASLRQIEHARQNVGGEDMHIQEVVFSTINLLLFILLAGVGVLGIVFLFRVLIKANKALDIWIIQSENEE